MAVRITRVPGAVLDNGQPMVFPDSALAHELCLGRGVELGAAAHNPFNLPGCINVAPLDPNIDFYRKSQVRLCGAYAEVDLWGLAEAIPLPDRSQDYVISSHVIEHCADPIGVFLEWKRVLKPGGVAFMIFPKRDALPADQDRPVSEVSAIVAAHLGQAASRLDEAHGGDQGHVFVYTLSTMLDVILYANRRFDLGWTVMATQETDDKVGNGHTVAARSR